MDASKINIVRSVENVSDSSIHGTLVDPNGAVIPGVEVRLFQKGKKAGPIVVSDDEGRFFFERLREGTYEIGVRAAYGFRSLVVANLELKAGERQELTLDLDVDPSVEQLVGILAVEPPINLTTTDRTTVFTRDMIDRIPGRKPFE